MKPGIQTPTNKDRKKVQMTRQASQIKTEIMKRDGLNETSET
jgi:hypothetical protein